MRAERTGQPLLSAACRCCGGLGSMARDANRRRGARRRQTLDDRRQGLGPGITKTSRGSARSGGKDRPRWASGPGLQHEPGDVAMPRKPLASVNSPIKLTRLSCAAPAMILEPTASCTSNHTGVSGPRTMERSKSLLSVEVSRHRSSGRGSGGVGENKLRSRTSRTEDRPRATGRSTSCVPWIDSSGDRDADDAAEKTRPVRPGSQRRSGTRIPAGAFSAGVEQRRVRADAPQRRSAGEPGDARPVIHLDTGHPCSSRPSRPGALRRRWR